jgi:hypothetical protein
MNHHNQAISEQLLAEATVSALSQTEKKLDAELASINLNPVDDLEAVRRRRIEELKRRAADEARWRQLGHLTYSELPDQKDWFEASKASERLITHFYRKTTWRCDIVDKHFEILAKKHIETRFVKIDAEKCPFLAERLSIVLMPTLIGTVNNFTHDRIEGFDELGGVDNFTTDTLEKRLAAKGMIDYDESAQHAKALEKAKQIRQANKNNPSAKPIYHTRKMIDSEDDASEDD